jgi:hypothetical protein
MIWKKGEKLPDGYYMLWCIEAAPNKSPFEYFSNKYGYKPTRAIVGKQLQTNLNIPEYIEIVTGANTLTPGHIGLR